MLNLTRTLQWKGLIVLCFLLTSCRQVPSENPIRIPIEQSSDALRPTLEPTETTRPTLTLAYDPDFTLPPTWTPTTTSSPPPMSARQVAILTLETVNQLTLTAQETLTPTPTSTNTPTHTPTPTTVQSNATEKFETAVGEYVNDFLTQTQIAVDSNTHNEIILFNTPTPEMTSASGG
jgi:hypothetical protein